MHQLLEEIFGSELIAIIIASSLPLIFITVLVIFAVLLERKVAGHMQDRLGPMRVGYHGILQTIADFFKLIQKEDIVADTTDKRFFNLAPVLVFAGSYAAYAALPFSSAYIGSRIDLGLFYIVAISSLVVAGILMAGWSSNNKYSLLGAMRSAAQIVSYEIPTVLVILSMVMISANFTVDGKGTLSLMEISEIQTSSFWNWFVLGGAGFSLSKFLLLPFTMAAFLIFLISSLAEVNRTPFDMPEAESELVAGYHTEYSGMKFAMFFLAEYANMFAVSAIAAAIFFGGYQSPIGYLGNSLGIEWLVPIEQFFWFSVKGVFFVFVQMWLRWTLPRVRVDQLMTICWKYLIPYAFVNLTIIGIISLI
ncbi:MAG: NADH-quinone oxidoreductase subunit NuoH [Melioribacteraceae bacterium]|nr:NADH-quinone oxidoreductase subunit NuoH [Melioribacteraceae bacterium]MCF8355945.1 NADH-quinone oxidoreductase subunit NuoH [Melioribacteraceae bacterium]MCF8395810.1 NADH-quinone oxidoreductase subunit NuoH [Melioribacteraceae bacterium]MCF8420802.1 NADH-quinone oxidoreductase subunit NuoH [Melioribacteraceae bacterium]